MADPAFPPTGASGRCRSTLLLWGPGLTVALGAGVVTSHGLYVVARASGVPAEVAWLYPLITDGLALVAYTATHRLTRNRSRYAWTVVIVVAGLSGLAQAVYLADGAAVARSPALRLGVGAWPAVAAATAAHLLDSLRRTTTTAEEAPSHGCVTAGATHRPPTGAETDEPSAPSAGGDSEGVGQLPQLERLHRDEGAPAVRVAATTRGARPSRSKERSSSTATPLQRPP